MKRTTNRMRDNKEPKGKKNRAHRGRQPETVHLHVSGKEREGERRWV